MFWYRLPLGLPEWLHAATDQWTHATRSGKKVCQKGSILLRISGPMLQDQARKFARRVPYCYRSVDPCYKIRQESLPEGFHTATDQWTHATKSGKKVCQKGSILLPISGPMLQDQARKFARRVPYCYGSVDPCYKIRQESLPEGFHTATDQWTHATRSGKKVCQKGSILLPISSPMLQEQARKFARRVPYCYRSVDPCYKSRQESLPEGFHTATDQWTHATRSGKKVCQKGSILLPISGPMLQDQARKFARRVPYCYRSVDPCYKFRQESLTEGFNTATDQWTHATRSGKKVCQKGSILLPISGPML